MQEQRREHYEGRVPKKSDRQIEIAIRSHRGIEVKYKRGETQPGEVQYERRATALLEDYKQSDEEIDDSDQVEVEIDGTQIVN